MSACKQLLSFIYFSVPFVRLLHASETVIENQTIK